MTSLCRCSRAWLSFLLLQDVGVIWMCYNEQANLLFKTATQTAARQYSLAVVFICIVRLFLLVFFESAPLHSCHITVTVVYSLSMLMEMFYYRTISTSTPNVVRVVVQVVTVVAFAVAQRWLYTPSQAKPVRRKGRLFAKHYLEGDLLDPPECDDVRELRKKQL